LTTRPGAAVPEYDEESSEAESESEADESDEEAESKPLGPQQDLSPLSASAYFEQALEVNPPGNDTTFRVYLNPAVSTIGSKHGAYLVCHHGGGSSGLSFAALAKEVKAKSGGELGVLAYDCRGHGEFLD
jgi:protein phosphatase methylesterase 1